MMLITAWQNQKEVTANAALARLDNALTATFDTDVTTGNITVNTAQMQKAVLIRAIIPTTPGRMVTLPGVARVILLHITPPIHRAWISSGARRR